MGFVVVDLKFYSMRHTWPTETYSKDESEARSYVRFVHMYLH